MIVKKCSSAGSSDKQDAFVEIKPGKGFNIVILKSPHKRFDAHITALVKETLKDYGLEECTIEIQDFGALDFVLRARLKAAAEIIAEDDHAV